jgi:hypothetical protein
MTIFYLRKQINLSAAQKEPCLGIGADMHLLETLLEFAPNSCLVVYVEP